jgi:hypothetical protein
MTTPKKIDPLYTIFEQHLFNFQDPNADRKSFIDAIVKEYLGKTRRMGLSVPQEWEENIFEELCFQVNTMLVKKIYGCLTINEFTEKTKAKTKQAKILAEQKKRARKAYQELNLAADQAAEKIQIATQSKANRLILKKAG